MKFPDIKAGWARQLAVPSLYLAIAIAAWLITILTNYDQWVPNDGYALVGVFLRAPQLWLGALAGCTAWKFVGLRNQGTFRRAAARPPLVATLYHLRMPLIVAPLSLLAAFLITQAWYSLYEIRDAHLLALLALMGAGATCAGAAIGTYLPRLAAIPGAVFGIFFLTYTPQTSAISWLRSFAGGGTSPSDIYEIDPRTLLATAIAAIIACVIALAFLCRSLPGTKSYLPLSITLSASTAVLAVTAQMILPLGYLPWAGRDVPTICSEGHPTWCVTAWNADQLPAFVALNSKIHEIEKRTGARFPERLSQKPPPGPGPSNNVDAQTPLGSARQDDGALNPILATELGLSNLINQCSQVPPFMNLTVAVYASQWWASQLSGRTFNEGDDLTHDIPAQTIIAMTEKQQAAWVNSVFEAPKTCDVPLALPGLDANMQPLKTTTTSGTP